MIISLRSNIVLAVLAALAIGAFLIVEYSREHVKPEYYNAMLAAAETADKAREAIKEHRLEKGIFIDNVNDPNGTALIGQKYTHITTDQGDIEAKLSSTNPNFAAAVVLMLKDAGITKNSKVAVGMTGSFPALNIATIAAIETIGAEPIIISSVGASDYGANDPYFTWPDMEKFLFDNRIIKHRSVAASIGGGRDIGRGLSPRGREMIVDAISRNNIPMIYEKDLRESVAKRIAIFDSLCGSGGPDVYINIGGGIASLGSSINSDMIEPGLTMQLPERNYPARGVLTNLGERGIPIIHLLNINRLLYKFKLPKSPEPLPLPGEGEIFSREKYNVIVVLIVTVIFAGILGFVVYKDRKRFGLENDDDTFTL